MFWGVGRHRASGVPVMPPQHPKALGQLHGCSCTLQLPPDPGPSRCWQAWSWLK